MFNKTKIISTFLFLLILTFLPSVYLAQNSDDNDGDGIKNSEDACPFEKGSLANKGCPSKDESSPASKPAITKNENPLLTDSDTKALADCQYVFEDAGCAKFVGKTLSEIQAYFGKSDSYGDYYRLGIHFWYYNDNKLEEITFQGIAPSDEYSPFVGKPGKKVDWSATTEETIAQYGTPNNRSELYDYTYLKYGNCVFNFKFNKLVSVVIKDFAAKNAREDATASNYKQTSKPTQENDKENAKRLAEQMESDYNDLLEQLEAKLREGERIVNSERLAIAAGGMFKNAVQKKINKVTAAGDSLIDQFSKKYQGKIPMWMVKGIQAKWRPVQNP